MGKKGKAPEICENCRHWEPMYDAGLATYDPENHRGAGECHRYPPTPVYVPDWGELAEPFWPETGVLNRCGEFDMMKDPRRTKL